MSKKQAREEKRMAKQGHANVIKYTDKDEKCREETVRMVGKCHWKW
jgi:hypothetical protein